MKLTSLRAQFALILPILFFVFDSSASVSRRSIWDMKDLTKPQWVLVGRDRPAKKKLAKTPSLSCFWISKDHHL